MWKNIKTRENEGITLIALVITIIVILILAGVTIQSVAGDNGILTQALNAKKQYEEASEDEKEKIEYLLNSIDNNSSNNKISSLFIWDKHISSFTELKCVTDYLNINTIYLGEDFGENVDFNDRYHQRLLKFAEQNNIDVWIVEGERSAVENNRVQEIKDLADKIYEYNLTASKKIKGISLDVEFFLTSTYKNGTDDVKLELYRNYVEYIKTCYQYAKSKNLKLVNCIPTWLDQKSEQYLEDLIANGCDYVQVMNYVKSEMIDAIDKEVEIAKKYNKKIENIVELQSPNDINGVTDSETFYNDGIEICLEKLKEIGQKYAYNLLGFSYHYYVPIVTLVNNVKDMSNKYDYEIYPKDSEGNPIDVKNIYLSSSDGKDIYGISYQINEEYVYRFYGLEYGKEYSVIIDDEVYEGSKNINYVQSDDKVKYGQIYLSRKSLLSLELYGWTENYTEEVGIDSGKMIFGDEEINGKIVTVRSSSGDGYVNILLFEQLEYDKEYTLEVQASGYTITQQYKYLFDDRDTDAYYKEIYFNKN